MDALKVAGLKRIGSSAGGTKAVLTQGCSRVRCPPANAFGGGSGGLVYACSSSGFSGQSFLVQLA